MSSIWDNEEEGGLTEQIRTVIGNNGAPPKKGDVGKYRASGPPLNDAERAVYAIFSKLRGKEHNLIEKRKIAEDLLLGQYGIKHELHAKLFIGPRGLEQILDDPRDIVPPLLEIIDDKDQNVREKIAKILAVRGDERTLFSVYAGMDSDAYSERHEFGLALGKMATNINDVGILGEMLREISERRKKRGEFSSAFRLVKKRLMDLGAVVEKPEKKLILIKSRAEKQGRGGVTLPMRIGRKS
jgi:hypothetical protein